jgi:hypothetical protein
MPARRHGECSGSCVGHSGAPALARPGDVVGAGAAPLAVTWRCRGSGVVLAAIDLLIGIPLGLALGRTVWQVVAENTPLLYVAPVAVAALVLIVPLALLTASLLAPRWDSAMHGCASAMCCGAE